MRNEGGGFDANIYGAMPADRMSFRAPREGSSSAASQPLLLDAADEVAQMGRGIQGDETPDAVVTFDDVDAGIVLLDLPEMAHRKT